MTVLRHKPTANYTCVPNAILADASLHIEDKTVLIWLLSKPQDWTFRQSHVADELKVGREKCQGIFRRLTAAGYVKAQQTRTGSQQWASTDYTVTDVPHSFGDEPPAESPQPEKASRAEKPPTAEPPTAQPSTENPTRDSAPLTTPSFCYTLKPH